MGRAFHEPEALVARASEKDEDLALVSAKPGAPFTGR
jgi:hypothetical protein